MGKIIGGNPLTEAFVDTKQRVSVKATSQSNMKSLADDGQTFIGATSQLTVTSNEGNMFFIKNTDTVKEMHINSVFVSWNGGSSNFNRPLYMNLYKNAGDPTDNETLSGLGNSNYLSGNTANATVYQWDETGSGMTQVAGQFSGNGIFRQGFSEWEIDGSIILGTNDSLTFSAKGQETGEMSILVFVYYEDKN